MIIKQEVHSSEEWNSVIRDLPGVSFLQTWEWGQVKAAFGWKSSHFIWRDDTEKAIAAAMILMKEISPPIIPAKFRTLYIPQGPLMDWTNKSLRKKVLTDISAHAKNIRAISIKMDPEVIRGFGEEISEADERNVFANQLTNGLTVSGWQYSTQQVQFKNTAWIDLNKSEELLLSSMKQKTRYNIRLAERKGVRVRKGTPEDLEDIYRMYLETSLRDGFIIRPKEYYLTVWSEFMRSDKAVPLIAEVEGEMVAGMILFFFANRIWYVYGMSTGKHREKMPNYLLQWEAIKLGKKFGCELYDLWGAPDIFDKSDNMWGVYRFKVGLGSKAVQRIGAYDLPVRKNAYTIFIKFLPRFLSITRKIRKIQQLQESN